MVKIIKFGGTSLKDKESRRKVIDIISREKEKLIVVVSAMGRYPDAYATKTLEGLISTKVTIEESNRIVSIGEIISSVILSNELQEENHKVISISSYQASIRVKDKKIIGINKSYIESLFIEHDVVIIPGFQGINEDGNLEILEPGDSDYSAVCLANLFGQDNVTLYSDVCGIYTGDPHYIQNPRLLVHVGYHQAIELASHKARIICLKALLEAQRNDDFIIHLKSTFLESYATTIDKEETNHKMMSIDFDYLLIKLEDPIDDNDQQYIIEWQDDGAIVKKEYSTYLKTPFSVLLELTKIHFVNCCLNNQAICTSYNDGLSILSNVEKDSYYIEKRKEIQEINRYHDTIVRDDIDV